MKRKILTLTRTEGQSNYEVSRLVKEAAKLGVEVNRCLYRDLIFDLEGNKPRIIINGEEINKDNTMGLWCRVAGTTDGKYIECRNLAIKILKGEGVACINSGSYLDWPRMGKISQHGVFIGNDIPIVPTRIYYTKKEVLNNDWEYPVIVKHERGYQGKSVIKIENKNGLNKFLDEMDEKELGMYLWQKCLPTKWDIRVIVLGDKVVGAMKRSAKGDEFRSNFSLGGEVEIWHLSESDKELALKTARACRLDYGGVDIMKDLPAGRQGENDKSYILEVNRQCQFKGFEKATGINVAKLIVELFLEKGKLI